MGPQLIFHCKDENQNTERKQGLKRKELAIQHEPPYQETSPVSDIFIHFLKSLYTSWSSVTFTDKQNKDGREKENAEQNNIMILSIALPKTHLDNKETKP